MASSANIGYIDNEGFVTYTRIHWDGYVSHTGKILDKHFNEYESVMNLINGGELRSMDYRSGTLQVEYYKDTDSLPIRKVALNYFLEEELEEYNYLYHMDENRWEVTAVLYPPMLFRMDLKIVLEEGVEL